jgi:hypothetical protein
LWGGETWGADGEKGDLQGSNVPEKYLAELKNKKLEK